jgi:plasmid stability protein
MLLQQRQALPVNQLTGKLAQMKTTLDLPDELVREMKLRALMQGRTLRDLAADFLRQGLGMGAPRPATPPPGSRVEIGADGLPIIRGSDDAPSRAMTAEALIALEQDLLTQEDMQRGGRSL